MTRCARSRLAPVLALACLLVAGRQGRVWADERSRFWVAQGISQFDHGRCRDALGSFLQALELDPKDEKALYWQARAAQALSEERRAQLRKEGLKIARDSLDRTERERVAALLCGRGYAALKSGDLASAAQFYRESRATTARHGCVALGLTMTRQALERKAARGEASAGEILILADFSRSGEGAWNVQTLAHLGAGGGAKPARGAANGQYAGPGGRASGVPPTRARSAIAEPRAKPDFLAFQTPAPVKTAPHTSFESPPPDEAQGAASKEHDLSRGTDRIVPVGAAAMAWPRPKAAANARPRRLVSSARNIGAAEELYMLAVADYMSGDADKARESLGKALKLDSDNARAGTLLKRIELEAR